MTCFCWTITTRDTESYWILCAATLRNAITDGGEQLHTQYTVKTALHEPSLRQPSDGCRVTASALHGPT